MKLPFRLPLVMLFYMTLAWTLTLHLSCICGVSGASAFDGTYRCDVQLSQLWCVLRGGYKTNQSSVGFSYLTLVFPFC